MLLRHANRSGWKSYSEVTSTNAAKDGTDVCTKCGTGILSFPMDTDESPNVQPNSTVAATPSSCFIKAGWGMTIDTNDFSKLIAVKPCPADTYGVENDTFGLQSAPCKAW